MASSVFTPCEGAIVKVNLCPDGGGGGGGTFNVTVGGSQIGFPTSGFLLEMQGNYQFLHALDEFIYYYNFGDRVGELTVSGFGFLGGETCNASGGGKSGEVCGILDFYLANRQSVKKRAIPVGTDRCGDFWAFLTGMRLEISSGSGGVPIGQWSLRFHVIPPRG
ncbi:hypothetical protein EBZ39_00250 [bacterium]|nr:hypothetical protein [bacterium]